MLDPRSTSFWQAVTKIELVDPQALAACWEAIPPEKRTLEAADRRLARRAVDAGLMTLWQAQQVLAGRQAGLRLDRYMIRELIGIGGMGRVYLAIDTKLRRPVALKILSKERVGSERAIARFRREARLGAQLQHQNLIRVYDEGDHQGVRFLVMEYITGQTIAQMIQKQGGLPWAMAASLTSQVAEGLEHLHLKGLLHRDVNPMNILVDRDGTAKLTDLGLAIDPNDDEEGNVTRDGATVGTFDYISPEQARHSRGVDTRGDIYSLGCSLYHMIAGRVPFPSPSLPEKLLAHQSKYPDPLPTVAPDVPAGLDAVVRRMMAKDPSERFARPRDVVKALKPYCSPSAVPDRVNHDTPMIGPVSSSSKPSLESTTGSSSTPPSNGSDPELRPAAIRQAPLQIDLGSEIGLVKRARSASRSDPERQVGSRPLKIGLIAAILVALAIAGTLVWLMGGGGSAGAAPGRPGDVPKARVGLGPGRKPEPTTQADSSPEVLVVYDNGETYEPSGLVEAIQFAAGKPASVVLALTEPLRLDVTAPLKVGDGPLRIRAAATGSAPVFLEFRDGSPFLQGGPRSSIRLEGLEFRLGSGPSAGKPPALIESGAAVRLERCGFAPDGPTSAAVRVLDFEGLRAEVVDCWVAGFSAPFDLKLYTSTQVQLVNSLIVGPEGGDEASAVAARPTAPRGSTPSDLNFENCTIVHANLLDGDGFEADRPLNLGVTRSVVSAGSLLRWRRGSLASLRFRGDRNRYGIAGPWIVGDPDAAPESEAVPSDYESWSRLTQVDEAPKIGPVAFADDPGTLDPDRPFDPARYRLAAGDLANDAARIGIDPNRIGPYKKDR